MKAKKEIFVSQKAIFFKNEGDAYHFRNKENKKDFKKDLLTKTIEKKLLSSKRKNILEIGCGDSQRLNYLQKKFKNNNYFGIDPSSAAIKFAKKNNPKLNLVIRDASKLHYEDRKFDFVIFGFCLYLCDDDDLFKIGSECYRVLKKNGLIIIEDFIIPRLIYNKYHHNSKIKSRKMDYVKMFDWHPRIKLEYKTKYLITKSKKLRENFVTVAVLKKIN